MNINPSHHHLAIPSEDRHPFFSYKNKTTDTLASAAKSATKQAAESGLSGKKPRYPTEKISIRIKDKPHSFADNVLAISKVFNNDEDLSQPDTFNFHAGCCYGLSACYILFNILGRSDIFNQLMNVLEQNPAKGWKFYNIRYKTLAKAIKRAQYKDKISQVTDSDTQLLLNLRPFLEMLAAIQSPRQTELGKEVPHHNMQQVTSYISDGNLNDSSAMKASPFCVAGLKFDGLEQFLTSLGTGISTAVPERLFSITSPIHAVAIKVTSSGYELFDINQKNYQKKFPLGTEAKLASTLQKKINPGLYEKNSSHNDILFKIQELYAPANHEYLQQGKHNLQSLYSNIPSEHLTDINQVCPYSKVTPLYVALFADDNEALSRILKQEKLDVDAPCDHRIFNNQARLDTALHLAAALGYTESINLLLDAEADATVWNQDNETPMHLAIQHGQLSAVQTLLGRAPETLNIPSNGMFPLIFACRNGNAQIVEVLLSTEDSNINRVGPHGTTPLLAACMEGNTEIVKLLLLEENIKMNTTDADDMTPLLAACMKENFEMVQLLLAEENIDFNQAGFLGMTPLYLACRKGNIEIVKLLLAEKDIDINLEDNQGRSPAFIAWQKGNKEIFNLLKERGAVIDSSLMLESASSSQ